MDEERIESSRARPSTPVVVSAQQVRFKILSCGKNLKNQSINQSISRLF